jgi:tetratricopeptide (TPR) repeat protein
LGGSEPEGRLLVERSFEELRRGDALASGWQEAYRRGAELAEEAIARDPRDAQAYYALFCNLGRQAERSGAAAQAVSVPRLKRLLDRVLELDPNHAHAWEARGEMLLRLPWWLGGSVSQGLEALERAATLEPSWAKPRLKLAEAHRAAGDRERAESHARAALEAARESGDDASARAAEALLRDLSESR